MTIDYETPPAPKPTQHDHIFTTLLGVSGFFLLIGILTLAPLPRSPKTDPATKIAPVMTISVEGAMPRQWCRFCSSALMFPKYRRWRYPWA